MDFFGREDQARAKTRRLVALYLVCVATMVLVLCTVTWWAASNDHALAPARAVITAWVGIGTLIVIIVAAAWKSAMLASGGEAVAALVGAQPLPAEPADPRERTLRHVVEEMAIASGTPMPRVFVLEDGTINAFAAGHTPADAAIVVTRGTLAHLNRDELQGVIAHEFSHLLNGDMRLNIRLIAFAFGLLVLALAGRLILRNLAAFGGGRSRSKKGGGQAVVVILAIGLTLMIVGYVGWFFAQVLKAGVSRQREFLADASAVQFTRNPAGIAGALKKIGGVSSYAALPHARAVEVNHLFFADAIAPPLFGLLATHPPLPARIRAIDPQWDGRWLAPADFQAPPAPPPAPATPAAGTAAGTLLPGVLLAATMADAATPLARVSPSHVRFSAALRASIPEDLARAARVPFSARAVALAAVLEAAPTLPEAQLQAITAADAALAQECRALWPRLHDLGEGARLPLIDLCTPALRQLTPGQRDAFRALLDAATTREETPLAERALARLVRARLQSVPPAPMGGIVALAPLAGPVSTLLGALAWAGTDDAAQADRACAAGIAQLGATDVLQAAPVVPAAADVDQAIDQLLRAAPGLRRRIVIAAAATISADGQVTVREAELLRAIADSLGVPLPPFLDHPATAA